MSPGETGPSGEAGPESGVLPDEAGAEAVVLPARANISAPVSDQALLCDDDAGEGPSSLIKEKSVPEQTEDEEKMLDGEQTGELKKELDGKTATCGTHPKRPLLGLVLTPTRELAVQVKQHIDAVAKFTGEV